MSRSYKKTPRSGDKKDKFLKNYANRKLRHQPIDEEQIELNHKNYKKNFCSWEICDYETIGETFEEYYTFQLGMWYKWGQYYNEPYPDKEKLKKEYNKYYIRK